MLGIESYLHIFFEDYLASNGMGYKKIFSTIDQAKDNIIDKNIPEMTITAQESFEYEKFLSDAYNINAIEMNEEIQESLKKAPDLYGDTGIFVSVDDAIKRLREAIKNMQKIDEITTASNQVMRRINNFLKVASQKGYQDRAITMQLKNLRKSLKDEAAKLKQPEKNDDEIKKNIKGIANNISGAMLELADPIGKIIAEKEGMSHIFHIGGPNALLKYDYKEDPSFKIEYDKLQNALQKNNGVQSKGDLIVYLKDKNIEGRYNSIVFQEKNYSDISSVTVAEYPFNILMPILKKYGITEEMMVNVAGTLAGDKYQEFQIPQSRRTYKNVPLLNQTVVDTLWLQIRNAAKNAMYSDAIVGTVRKNITNKVNYYVVRDKTRNRIIIVSASEVLKFLISKLEEEKNNDIDINTKMNKAIQVRKSLNKNFTRQKYWSENLSHFEVDERDTQKAAQERNAMAYSGVLNLIKKNKIGISINFAQIFNELSLTKQKNMI